MTLEARFPIGTQYTYGGKNQYVCTITDILKTYNSKGELVKIRYEAYHMFMGQVVTDHDVLDTTIARNLLPQDQHLLK